MVSECKAIIAEHNKCPMLFQINALTAFMTERAKYYNKDLKLY